MCRVLVFGSEPTCGLLACAGADISHTQCAIPVKNACHISFLVICACRERGWLDVRLHKTGRHAPPPEPAKAAPELAPHDSASDLTLASRASKRLKALVAPLGPKTPRRCGIFSGVWVNYLAILTWVLPHALLILSWCA